MTQSIADLHRNTDRLIREVQVLQLQAAHPRLTEEALKVIGKFSLTASAMKGRVPIREIDEALAATKMTTWEKIEVKLKLRHAGVI